MKHWNLDVVGNWLNKAAQMKMVWNLAPVLQNWHLSINWPSVVTEWIAVRKIYLKMHLVSCTNTHHDVTDLINCEIIENTKTWKSWERNITFLRNKKSLKPTSNDTFHILRSYCFVAEVTLKIPIIKYPGNLHLTLLLRHPQPLLQSFGIEEY